MYVDVWVLYAESWQRVTEDAKLDSFGNTDVFKTVQKFMSSVREKQEKHTCPLFFDLDNDNLDTARKDALHIVEKLYEYTKDINIYFSGKKGFHIIVDIEQEPSLYATAKIGVLATQFAGTLQSFDKSVYTAKRQLRVVNSIHSGSNLHKIQLSKRELEGSIEKIKKLAEDERPIKYKKAKSKPLADLFNKIVLEKTIAKVTTSKYNFDVLNPPLCVNDLLLGGWKQSGQRNQATIQVACFLKEAKVSLKDAINKLTTWVKKHTTAIGKAAIDKRINNTISVVTAVYEDSTLAFSCAAIRALHGAVDKKGNYERVSCNYNTCYARTTVVDNYKKVTLSQVGIADMYMNSVTTTVLIVGRSSKIYFVPKSINITCPRRATCKDTSCSVNAVKSLDFTVSKLSDNLLAMCGKTKGIVKSILREETGIPPACTKAIITVNSVYNVTECVAIPKVNAQSSTNSYVTKTIFVVDNMDTVDNKYYQLYGKVLAHPNTQVGTLLVTAVIPVQTPIDSFSYTNTIHKMLKKEFRPNVLTKNMVAAKVDSLLKEITSKSTHIYGRENTLLSVLLTYHSVIYIKIPEWQSDLIRGWVETVIIGDTGTGKSALISSVVRGLNLGSEVNAEVTTRTGLTYKLEQTSSGSWSLTWGMWPRSDKSLLWLDECSALEKAEYGQMTLARSAGVLSVHRAASSEIACRVRLLLSGNVPNGKTLNDYTRGSTSLSDIFNAEDIRRFDLGLFLKSSDLDYAVYAKANSNEVYDYDALRQNVIFAWSLQPDDIIIPADTLEAIAICTKELNAKYGAATDIPLVNPSDIKYKLLRLSTSLAVLIHNVINNKLVVDKVCVYYVKDYINTLYSSASCGLQSHSAMQDIGSLVDYDFNTLLNLIVKTIPALSNVKLQKVVFNALSNMTYITLKLLDSQLMFTRDDTKMLIFGLESLNLLVNVKSHGRRKTQMFNQFLNDYLSK